MSKAPVGEGSDGFLGTTVDRGKTVGGLAETGCAVGSEWLADEMTIGNLGGLLTISTLASRNKTLTKIEANLIKDK
jgi:hypothetical protein